MEKRFASQARGRQYGLLEGEREGEERIRLGVWGIESSGIKCHV